MTETITSSSPCRICMDAKIQLVSIFSGDLSRKVSEIADVQVQEGDGLPPSICEDCEIDLERCYRFRTQIIWADTKFRERLSVSEVVFEECHIKQEGQTFINEENQEDDDDDRPPSDNDDDDYDMRDDSGDKIDEIPQEKDQPTDPIDHVEIIENRTKQELHNLPSTDGNSQDEPLIVAQMKRENEPSSDPLMQSESQQPMDTESSIPGPSTSTPTVKGTELDINWQGTSYNSMSKIDSEYVMLQQPDHFLSGLTLPTDSSVKSKPLSLMSRTLRSRVGSYQAVTQARETPPYMSLVSRNKGGRKSVPPQKYQPVVSTRVAPETSKTKTDDDICQTESNRVDVVNKTEENIPQVNDRVESEEAVDEIFSDSDYCQICDIKFLTGNLLKEHLAGEDFTCRRCTLWFQTHSELKSHFYTHRTYICHVCKKQFYVRKDLETHKEVSPSCGTRFECADCGKKFWRQRSLAVHFHYHHENKDEDYKCNVCLKSFRVKEQLQYHLKIVHVAYEQMECRMCHKLLLGPLKMKHHMKMVHIKDQEIQYTFSCQLCNKVFKNELTLRKHQEVHDSPILCELCGKSYHCRTTLLSHIRSDHTKVGTYNCVPCNKTFGSEAKYKYHLKKAKIHSNRESSQHFCEICGKSLLSSNALKRHMITHTGEKPFKCSVCGAEFNQRSSLVTHERVHSGENKFNCDTCGMNFKWKQTFTNHLKKCKRGPDGELEEPPDDEIETSNRFINTFTGFRLV